MRRYKVTLIKTYRQEIEVEAINSFSINVDAAIASLSPVAWIDDPTRVEMVELMAEHIEREQLLDGTKPSIEHVP